MVNYQENVYARRGLDGRSHIPALPFWVAIVRIFQILLAFIILILSAYSLNKLTDFIPSGELDGHNFSFFAFAWTVSFILYVFLTPLFFPKFYLYWVHLGLEVLSVVFWLATFATLASEQGELWWKALEAAIKAAKEYEKFGFSDSESYSDQQAAINSSKAALGLAVINWLLFIVTLVSFSIYLHKHRTANGETGFGGFTISRSKGDVEAARQEKTENQQPVELTNVPQYPQQPPQAH